jgi:ubiquinone/menaquinone biosynthesis C-methylase UbiE
MKRDFDLEAKTWDSHEPRRQLALGIAESMLGSLALSASDTVLDYGAGSGLVSLRLSPLVSEVICADSSQGMLDVVAEKVAAHQVPNVRTLLLDLEHEQPSLTVSVLVSSMTMHHIEDIPKLARAFFKLVASGGRIALADLDKEEGDFHADNTGVAHFGFDRDYLLKVFSEAGFTELRTQTAYRMTKLVGEQEKTFDILLLTGVRP